MLGSIDFSKKALLAVNIFNMVVSIILISVGAHCNQSSELGSIPIVGGITACGVFLFFISVFGCFATYTRHQSFLFYFMISLAVLLIIQFSISVACLDGGKNGVDSVVRNHWQKKDNQEHLKKIHHAEEVFQCCGLDDSDQRCNSTNKDDYWVKERKFCYDNIGACATSTSISTSTITTKPTETTTKTTKPTITTTTKASTTTTIKTTTTPTKAPTTTKPPTRTVNGITTTTNPTTTTTNATTVKSRTTTEKTTVSTVTLTTAESTSNNEASNNKLLMELETFYAPLKTNDECAVSCQRSYEPIKNKVNRAYNTCGGLGIFFSLQQPLAIFLAYRFRNQIGTMGY